MTRRTYPARRIADLAFPIRIKVIVPGRGFGKLLDDITAWLKEYAPGRAELHPVQGYPGKDVAAFYFRTIDEAAAFVAAFPGLVLADDVARPDGLC